MHPARILHMNLSGIPMSTAYTNITDGEIYDSSFLYENCPEDKMGDVDYVLSLMDWERMWTHITRRNISVLQ